MKTNILTGVLTLLLLSCGNNDKTKAAKETVHNFQNKGHELVYNMVQEVGDFDKLLDRNDVVYTYTYQTPDGKTDVATEKYIFKGELSYGAYRQHERTIPELEGVIEQGYDGNEFWLKHNKEILTEQDLINKVVFNRPTNFYWFTMMQKLLDDGLEYEYIGEKAVDSNAYDIVKVTFDLAESKATDIYQVYINKKTGLIDQFLFTVADFNLVEIPYLMELEYENIDGILLPTKRKYQKSNWNGEVTEELWTKVTWANIKFNNGLTKEDFKK